MVCHKIGNEEGGKKGIKAIASLVFYAYDLSYRQVMNSYVLGIEIMQGLSGSLGVVLTVPVTAAIAAFLTGRKKRPVT